MSILVVRYRPRPDQADDNQTLVEAVFDQLSTAQPDGVRYACLRLEDDTFVHIADIDTEPNPLLSLEAFRTFSTTVTSRCDLADAPKAQPATIVGNYHLLG